MTYYELIDSDPNMSPEVQGIIMAFNEKVRQHEKDVRDKFREIDNCPTLSADQKSQLKRDLGDVKKSPYERQTLEEMDELLIEILENSNVPNAANEIAYLQSKIAALQQLDDEYNAGLLNWDTNLEEGNT